jgi:expansin
MQVVNSNVPVKSLEVSTDGAKTWQPTVRRDYNFFENPSGFGVDVVDVRITSITGETIVINNVSSASESSTTGNSNFS